MRRGIRTGIPRTYPEGLDSRRRAAIRLAALCLLCLLAASLFGCAHNISETTVYCNDDEYTSYPGAVAHMLPAYAVKEETRHFPFTYLGGGAVVESSDTQAVPAVESGAAEYWYPQYLATVVIAIDRDRTSAAVGGWRDLVAAGEVVGMLDNGISTHMIFAAISYALEGENFTLGSAADLLAQLQSAGHFERKTLEAPILICYDHQAAALIQSGRNIEIVVPGEGTLTYVRGLLSNTALTFTGDTDELLLAAGLRLPDGRCDEALYPAAAAYANADRVADYAHLNAAAEATTRVFRRSVLRMRMYTSADQSEHQYFVMFYIILVVIWTASFVRRAMQKRVRRAALLIGVILLGWIIVRLVKYQLDSAVTLNRYLWYVFYLFQLSLPLVLLWLAWAADKQDGTKTFPLCMRILSAINAALIVLVLTNDLHSWVFKLDLSNPNWSNEYGYGLAYYVVLAASFLPILAAIVVMLVKSGRNPRKGRFFFPLAFVAVLGLYGFGYITRVPIAWESDFTMVIGLFTLLFIEACLRTGMIPVNSKYAALFTHSPIRMQILDNTLQPALSSASAMRAGHDMLRLALAAGPLPVETDENTLLFAAPITGGYALWQEDVGGLNRLHAQVEESVRKLTAANAVLAEEEKIKRAIDEENAKTQLMMQLEAEIVDHTSRLSDMIAGLGSAARPAQMARIALLLCYVKRRCNLFFRERETDDLPAVELNVYLDELAEIAEYAGVKIIVTNEVSRELSVRTATLFYDFFYTVVDWAAQEECAHMLVHLHHNGGDVAMRLLPSADAQSFVMEHRLQTAITAAGGTFAVKDLDDALGISLTFPKGGAAGV